MIGYGITNGTFFGLATPSAQFRSGTTSFKTLSQTVSTVIGERYKLTYSALNQENAANQFNVTTGGLTTSTSFSEPFQAFSTFTQTFIASSEHTLIKFAVQHGGAIRKFFFVDDVSLVNIVLELESWAMLIAGFGLIGAAARRRRNGRVMVA